MVQDYQGLSGSKTDRSTGRLIGVIQASQFRRHFLSQRIDLIELTVLELSALLLNLVEGDVVGDDEGDLELLDSVTNGDEGRGTPDEALLLDRADGSLQGSKVGLVVP